MCVYAYTDEIFDIYRDKSYENGKMREILFNKLKKYNKTSDINNLSFQYVVIKIDCLLIDCINHVRK